MDVESLWQQIIQTIRREVGEGIHELWFKPIKALSFNGSRLELGIPNRFFKEWIEDYHPTLISDILARIAPADKPCEIAYVVMEEDPSDRDAMAEEARREDRKAKLARKGIHLNPKYTFESFVTGPSNQFAEAAARAVSQDPGRQYNPLFVYGGVGLGKTHLITSIGNSLIDRGKKLNVLYVSSEQFTNEVVSAFRHGKTAELKNKFRNLDVLLMDDVQFIENKTATQEELFHTLNALYEKQKQIVLSSDRPPKEIKSITDRLRSRFGMGLIADIQPPEIETRIAIIHKKAEAERIFLPPEVVEFVASKIRSNIRDIEGCLIRLGAHSSLTGAPITMGMARNLLKDFMVDDGRPLGVEQILKTVSDYFGVKVVDIKGKKRTKDVAVPRQIAMFIARELTDCSLSDIGKQIGGKDHATVIYASKQIKARCGEDEQFGAVVENLLGKLRPS